ncbi:MAG TPA: leucyl/phenylalanyl-tRNA--protein transferase [Xanthobacteraceae bacterium]|nr:leucyl/phenylalanyl-tRNA--protein transferase [Xanthobacteraceae bacterium]
MGIELRPPPFVAADREIAARRDQLFRETALETARRWALGFGYALRPHRVTGIPALSGMWLKEMVAPARSLPRAEQALARPAGLCGIVRDLSVPTLIEAHRRGLYPHAHIPPLKWWSPPERYVLFFDQFHMSKRLRSRLRQARHTVTFDRDFERVIKACAEPREGKWPVTWITPAIMRAYAALHDAGYAHSFEVWNTAGELVGGGYGVAIGGAFTIESQFTRESHCSKIGFAALNWHLAHWGFHFSDNKGPTRNTIEMGFQSVPRSEFIQMLADATNLPSRVGKWSVEADLKTVAAWEPNAGRSLDDPPQSAPQKAPLLKRAHATSSLLVAEAVDGEILGWGVLAGIV